MISPCARRACCSARTYPPSPLRAHQALGRYGLGARDLIQTPLGVNATVLGVHKKTGILHLMYPGKVKAPLPTAVHDKESMERYGYKRRPNWAHIERRMLELSLLQKAGVQILPPLPSIDDDTPAAVKKGGAKGRGRSRSKSKSKKGGKSKSKTPGKLRRSKSAAKRKSRSG